ncbi:MAG: 4-phosphoerythronate dehydrogenase PdxB [Candidatus Azobacteroides sp.]|nr:4-phosphoerythronate dehydrogenase PdxB [Candidatus Azobacteroides sp.]
MKIVADNKIPFLKGIFEPFANVVYLPGSHISKEDILDANALIVRTRTKCNEKLLAGTSVRFIGTATIGFDHIDTSYCDAHGITWKNAPGSNADSVAQYIIASLLVLSIKENFSLPEKTIGIVGVGNVGKRIAAICQKLGMNILLNDPPRAMEEKGFVDIETICRESDIITFHTPLSYSGPFATFHAGNHCFFDNLLKKPVIINSARGEVLDTNALKEAYAKNKISGMIIDCWEKEPTIDRGILNDAFLGTPHIAGYSADGKANATRMIVKALSAYFRLNPEISSILPPGITENTIDLDLFPDHRIARTILSTYQPAKDSCLLKEAPALFESYRENYPVRREFNAFYIKNASIEEKDFLLSLGFQPDPAE